MLLFSLGHFVVYQYNLYQIKQQMQLAVKSGDYTSNQLQTFVVNAGNSKFIREIEIKEEGREICYKDKMYDVVSVTIEKGQLKIVCLADDDESQVIAGFTKFLDANHGIGKKAIKLVKFDAPIFALNELPGSDFACYNNSITFNKYLKELLPQQFYPKPFPPPRAA